MITKTKQIIIEATCDICGDDCMKPLYTPNTDGDGDDDQMVTDFEGMELEATWGYSSDKDGEIWRAVVCEKCVDLHLAPLIKFIKTTYI